MKKTSLWLLAAGILLASSCNNEDIIAPANDGNVSFTVDIPDAIGSRAFGDGLSAKTLKYAVYDADNGDALVKESSASFGNALSTTVSLSLANGRSYKIAFFAYLTTNSVYTFNAANKTVTVNYSSMTTTSSQSYDFDCFYKLEEFTVSGPISKTVTLTRPVAQINWGTDDYDTSNGAVNQAYGSSLRTKMTVKACSKLYLLTGDTDDEAEVTFSRAQNPIADSYGSFPVDGYKWLNSKYILVAKDAPVMDMKLLLHKGSTLVNTVEVTNVPVGRNHRTNIYGSLLTSPVNITVVKDEIFSEPANDKEVWHGEATTPKQDANGNYLIAKASDMAGLAAMVNGGNSLSGKTVLLTSDIDLGNLPWTPVGTKTAPFLGSFDGQNHIVKNVNVDLCGKPSTSAGLFGYAWQAGELKNVTLDGVTINAIGTTTDAGFGSGALVGTFVGKSITGVTARNVSIKAYRWSGGIAGYTYTNISGCKVEKADIALEFENTAAEGWTNCDKAGGLVGIANENANVYEGNTLSDITISGYRHLGGIIGYAHGESIARNNSVNNVTITQTFEHNYKTLTPGALVSGTLGGYVSGTDADTNTATNVTIYKPSLVSEPSQIAEALAQGGYVGIEADLNLSSLAGTITLDKPTTIDLKGHNITLGSSKINNNAELTIQGEGTLSGNAYFINNGTEGKLTINGGDFETTGTAPLYNEGDLEINGGSFKGSSFGINDNLASAWPALTDKTIIINGGTFIATGSNYALSLMGSSKADSGNKAIINGGTFIGNFGAARADNGIDVTINGGTFICNGSYHGFCTGAENYGSQYTRATINGGYFYAANSGYALCKAGQSTMVVNGAVINKTGGSFTLGTGAAIVDADESIEVDGTTYTFAHKVVVQ